MSWRFLYGDATIKQIYKCSVAESEYSFQTLSNKIRKQRMYQSPPAMYSGRTSVKVELIAVLMSLGFNYALRCHTRKPPAQLSLLNSGSFWKHTCFSPPPSRQFSRGSLREWLHGDGSFCRLPAGFIFTIPMKPLPLLHLYDIIHHACLGTLPFELLTSYFWFVRAGCLLVRTST